MTESDRFLKALAAAAYRPVADLAVSAWRTREPVPFRERTGGRRVEPAVGRSWGGLFDCAWFRFTGRVPTEARGRRVVLLIDVNGEACVVDAAGNPVQGLTNAASTFDYSLGRPGKRVVPVAARARGGEKIDVWADAGANDLFGELRENGELKEACIAVCDEAALALYYDVEVLSDLLACLPEAEPRALRVRRGLEEARHAAGGLSRGELEAAKRITAGLLSRRGGDPSLTVSAVGHAHIDLAWLWPFRESVRKCARTFSTALAFQERYPDYVFGASQPQQWQWMKEGYPALYARMKAAVKSGRMEPQGAMWVEADVNLTCGESIVRQILFGKRFFRDEFGVEVRNLWLPDAFGYTAALPQILKKSGVDWFMTQKLSWSRTNRFPHHSFHWKGIDGSEVLTHMLPESTYNSPALPRSVRKIDLEYAQRDVSGRALMLFGIGDGGGGPGEEHLERLARMKNLLGVSPVRQEPATRFFEDWRKEAARFPTWEGELYLERHEGTFTTHGANKRANRGMEKALREAEWSAVLASRLCGKAYPRESLAALWRDVLLFQFHDVLPGSSIKRVYDETAARYRALREEAEALIRGNLEEVASRLAGGSKGAAAPTVLFNTLSWRRLGWLKQGRSWIPYDVPSMGFALADPGAPLPTPPRPSAGPRRLENEVLKVAFDAEGAITSVFDKRLGCEALSRGARANRPALFRDTGDAWDFSQDYREKPIGFMELSSARAGVDGPCAWMEQEYRYGHSTLSLRVTLLAGSARLTFSAMARWREPRTMLRVSFPLAVRSPEATCGIAFGSIRRPTHSNTSWDRAKDEVPCHGWADVSRRDRGAALLSDGKYGFRLKDGALDLQLLRSAPYPGPALVKDGDVKPGEPHNGFSDQCDHEFTYAFFPHPGDHTEGRVVREACEMAFPVKAARPAPRPTKDGAKTPSMAARGSFFSVDAEEVILETVKQAEDGDGVVLRLYESSGAAVKARVSLSLPVASAEETDLMEENGRRIAVRDGAFGLSFGPFEIKTVKVKLG